MKIGEPSLGLNREYLIKGFEDKDVQAYYRYTYLNNRSFYSCY